MHRGLSRVLLASGVGAASGALAAFIAYRFREPEDFSLDTTLTVDDITISDQLWCIVGLLLLGFLVCGSIATVCTYKKGPLMTVRAVLVAGPLGAALCWGSRYVMDLVTYAIIGPPDKTIDILDAAFNTFLPWIIWQVGCGFALSMPIAIAIGLNKYTFLRGLIGSGLVMALGFLLSNVIGIVMLVFALGTFAVGGNATDVAQTGDVMYLFVLGAAAGIAFGLAEAVYKPAWLKGLRGPSEGRTWTLQSAFARIGCQEGVEVYLPPDGTVAPIHAQIQAEEDAHFIVDLVGGLTVNNVQHQSTWLADGDRIAIGSALLLYRTRLDSRPKEAPSTAAIPQPKLQPVLVDAMGGRHPIKAGVTIIGRDVACDIALTWEPSVSRRHAELTFYNGEVAIRDLGSTNGTHVDGQVLTNPVTVSSTTAVTLGKCQVSIAFEQAP